MVNFYSQLKVSPIASEDEIKKAINRELRLWSNRTNAPKMEIRQEAERMMKQLGEAERILLDAAKRKEYDLQLQTAPTPTGRLDESVIHEGVDLVQEGWRLLIAGNIAEAIYVATQATQRDSGNSEAWALLGQAKYRWGEIEDAIYEYKRAINLRPNEASYYFDLGCVYESTERWSEALQQFQRAVQIDPSVPMYRAGIGILLIKNEKYQEGIEILERCVKEEPDNNSYQLYLAIAYVESAYQRWTYVPEGSHVPTGYYATHLEQVREAQACLDKAEQLKVTDSELEAHIRQVRANIDSMLERKFHGNWMAPIIAVVVGIIVLSQAKTGDILLGLLILASGILYFPASLTPQYIVNRRVIAGKVDAASSFLGYLAGENVGCLWMFIGGILLAIFTPVLTAWNFYRNYLAEGFSSPKESSQNKTLIIAVGGGAIVVVLLIATYNFFPRSSQKPIIQNQYVGKQRQAPTPLSSVGEGTQINNNNMVYVLQNKNYVVHYNNKTININKNSNLIDVWVKRKYSHVGKSEFLYILKDKKTVGENYLSPGESYLSADYSLLHYLLNYKDMKYIITHITYYSAQGRPLFKQIFPEEWNIMKPNSIAYGIADKIMADYSLR